MDNACFSKPSATSVWENGGMSFSFFLFGVARAILVGNAFGACKYSWMGLSGINTFWALGVLVLINVERFCRNARLVHLKL